VVKRKQADPPRLHPRQAFVVERVARSQLRNAPYNPRRIDEHAKAKIRANLERVGLVSPPTWNKRTGNLVGGHQRLSILDALSGEPDYLLDVAVVDLDDHEERAQNLFLNNGSAQGWWDEEALGAMLKEMPGLADLGGFDPADLAGLLDGDWAAGFLADDQTDEAKSAAQEVEDAAAAAEKWRKERERQKAAQQAKNDAQTHTVVVVCESAQQADAILRHVGGDVGGQYVDARRVLAALGAKER